MFVCCFVVQGDGIVFANLWNSIVEELKTQVDVRLPPHYLSSSRLSVSTPTIQLPANPAADVDIVTTQLGNMQIESTQSVQTEAEQTLKCLLKMLTCDFIDIRLQAIIALYQIACVDEYMADIIVNNDECLHNLLDNLVCDYDEINDAVVPVLSFFAARKPDVVCALLKQDQYMEKLDDLCYNGNPVVFEHCAKIVALLFKQFGSFDKIEEFKASIICMTHEHDESVQAKVRSILQ
jgi:hypothetical protein